MWFESFVRIMGKMVGCYRKDNGKFLYRVCRIIKYWSFGIWYVIVYSIILKLWLWLLLLLLLLVWFFLIFLKDMLFILYFFKIWKKNIFNIYVFRECVLLDIKICMVVVIIFLVFYFFFNILLYNVGFEDFGDVWW